MRNSEGRLRCLAISGSLRGVSSNTTVLRAAARLASAQFDVSLYEGLAQLPHFNPDLDVDPAPPPVALLRAALAQSTALIVSAPEYAHGVPGALKNALDWLVSGVELTNMPVALIGTSPYAVQAQAALAETLRTMGAQLAPEHPIILPLAVRQMSEDAIVADAIMSQLLSAGLATLARAASEHA